MEHRKSEAGITGQQQLAPAAPAFLPTAAGGYIPVAEITRIARVLDADHWRLAALTRDGRRDFVFESDVEILASLILPARPSDRAVVLTMFAESSTWEADDDVPIVAWRVIGSGDRPFAVPILPYETDTNQEVGVRCQSGAVIDSEGFMHVSVEAFCRACVKRYRAAVAATQKPSREPVAA